MSGTLNYHDTFFENHNVDAMIGGEYFDYQYFNFNASTENSPFDTIHTLNVGANRTATSSSKTGYRIESLFGRVNYDFKQKYLFHLSLRRYL